MSDMNKTVTIGLPLPNLLSVTVDVSWPTRQAIDRLIKYSSERGITVWEECARSVNVAHNHNDLGNKFRGDWLLVCGSDHSFSPDALELLLKATEEYPYPRIIGGISPFRSAPYRYVVNKFDKYGEGLSPDRKSTRLNSSHIQKSRMPSSA